MSFPGENRLLETVSVISADDAKGVLASPFSHQVCCAANILKLREYIPHDELDRVFEDIHFLTKKWARSQHEAELDALKWREDHAYESLLRSIQNQSSNGGEKHEEVLTEIDAMYPFWSSHRYRPDLTSHGHRPDWSLRLAQTLRDTQHSNVVSSLRISLAELVSGSAKSTENCDAWTAYICESKALRSIHVVSGYSWRTAPSYFDPEKMEQLLYKAVAANPGLQALHLEGEQGTLSMQFFVPLLQTKETLRELYVETRVLGEDHEHAAFSDALGANRFLRKVSIQLSSEKDLALFPKLSLIPCLEEAYFHPGYTARNRISYEGSMSTFVASSSSLCHLSLYNFWFSDQEMNRFIEALKGQPGLTKLSLSHCHFVGISSNMLVHYFESCSTVREFDLTHYDRLHLDLSSSFQTCSLQKLLSTTKPSLVALRLWLNWEMYSELAQWLATHPGEVRIACLGLQYTWTVPTWLLECIEGLRHVKSLEVVIRDRSGIDLDDIKRALKKNPNLHSVVFTMRSRRYDDDILVPVLTSAERRLIDAYGQRNQELPVLLSTTGPNQSCLSNVPDLLAAALPLPPKALHTRFLSGMLVLDANEDHEVAVAAALGGRKRMLQPSLNETH